MDPESSAAENEIERLVSSNRRLKYEIKDSRKNSRKQEKIINQLNRKLFVLIVLIPILIAIIIWQAKSGYDFQEKQKEFQAFEQRFNSLEMEKQSLENENQKHKYGLEEEQEKILNQLHGNFKFFIPILIAMITILIWQVKSGNRLEMEKRRLESENQKYKNDLQEKVKAIEELYNTFIKR